MEQWIERYIQEVVQRLPEKERADITEELKAHIHDMLPENADEQAVKDVLQELGPPEVLAEQYRAKPRYLISPTLYPDYVRVLKWLLPIVGCICLAVGMVIGVFDAVQEEKTAVGLVAGVLGHGLSIGISGAFWALLFVTGGFVIAERSGAVEQMRKEWRVDNLPEKQPQKGRRIPLSDTVAELIVLLVLGTLALLLCCGVFSPSFVAEGSDQLVTVFHQPFLQGALVVTLFLMIGGLIANVAKLKTRHWSPLVCGLSVAESVLSMGAWLWLLHSTPMFDRSFIEWLQGVDWGDFDATWLTANDGQAVIVILTVIAVVSVLGGVGTAVYKTFRANTLPQWTVGKS